MQGQVDYIGRCAQQDTPTLPFGKGFVERNVAVHGPRVTAVQVRTRCGIMWAIRPQDGYKHPRNRIGVSDRCALRVLTWPLRSISPKRIPASAYPREAHETGALIGRFLLGIDS